MSFDTNLDTNHQRTLQASFIQKGSGYKSSATRPACQRCCKELGGKMIRGWVKGYIHSNKAFVKDLGAFQCTNCRYTVVYKQKARVEMRIAPTDAQQTKIDKIHAFFVGRSVDKQLSQFEVKPDGYSGGFNVVVRTSGNVYVASGGLFHVGRAIKCLATHDLTQDREALSAHYNYMLNH